MRAVPLKIGLAAAVSLLLLTALAARACVGAEDARDRAEARLAVAREERRVADEAARIAREALADTTRDMIAQEQRAQDAVAAALRSRDAAERKMEAASRETSRVEAELERHRAEIEALPAGEVAARLSSAYPAGLVVPGPDGAGVRTTADGTRAILADLQQRVDLLALADSQRSEIESCSTALGSSRAAGLGYLQELDAVRRRLDATQLALDHTEASRQAAQAEIKAWEARRPPSRWRRYLAAAGIGAAAATILAK